MDATNRSIVTVMAIILVVILLLLLIPRTVGYTRATVYQQRVVPMTMMSVPWYRTISTSLTPVRTTPTVTTHSTSSTYYPPATVTYQPGTTSSSTYTCTADAMQCPDGSYVSRSGPQCQFAACPGQ
jgi:hypothetical protein